MRTWSTSLVRSLPLHRSALRILPPAFKFMLNTPGEAGEIINGVSVTAGRCRMLGRFKTRDGGMGPNIGIKCRAGLYTPQGSFPSIHAVGLGGTDL